MTPEIKKSIADTFKRFEPERIVLFGSLARGETDEYSNMDR